MQIQKINPFLNYKFNQTSKSQKQDEPTVEQREYATAPVTFGARVDKGLVRFYETNAGRMPKTVKNFIEKLPNKDLITPLAAQAAAFAAIGTALSVEDIKESFPDEELFKDLSNPKESKATRGILGTYRENKELLELCNQDILTNKENFTVWLVKKIFLEGKTVDEINKDLKDCINPDFKKFYDAKEADGQPVRSSTLRALGIKMPAAEYMQSLRYTRDGYSDIVGERISQVQKAFWESMPIEERTARARKSVEKFENWWNSLTYDQHMDMIAEQIDEIKLLEEFNNSDIGRRNAPKKTNSTEPKFAHNTEKSGQTTTLSRDDLFKIWATNNLKIFKANLTPYDLERIQTKRAQNRAAAWENMTPEERTEYISKLKAGTEPLKYAMIDAWNNCPNILIQLSLFLKRNNIHDPANELYNDKTLSENMRDLMNQFWGENPDYAKTLGQEISKSHQKVKTAIDCGNFESLKKDIIKSRNQREKITSKEVKEYMQVDPLGIMDQYPQYLKSFMKLYKDYFKNGDKFLPKEYYRDFFQNIYTDITEEQVNSWSKLLKHEELSTKDLNNVEQVRQNESESATIMNRALEAALADTLYKCTGDPSVFTLSQSDCKIAVSQILNNDDEICFYSEKLQKLIKLPIKNSEIDKDRISNIYNECREPLSFIEAGELTEQYFRIDNPVVRKKLKQYITLYGRSIFAALSPFSPYSADIKEQFFRKFLYNLPKDLTINDIKPVYVNKQHFEIDDKIAKIDTALTKKYSYIDSDDLDIFFFELNKALRNSAKLDNFEKMCCNRKRTPDTPNSTFSLRKEGFTVTNYLLISCLEQAMADVMYESCRDEKVYALRIEELFEELESLNLVKKFPYTASVKCENLDTNLDLKFKKKINFYQIHKLYKDYMTETLEYINECLDEDKSIETQEVIYILNPDEEKTLVDQYTKSRLTDFSVPINGKK